MRITMIVSHFQPPITGGEIYNYKLYEYLKSKFPKVDLISLHDTPFRFKGGFILRNLWFLKVLRGNEREIVIIEDFAKSSDLFLFNLITKSIRKVLSKKVKIIPLVHHIYAPLIEHKFLKAFKHITESIYVNETDAVIVNSEFTKGEIEKLLKTKKDILIAYPGLDTSLCRSNKASLIKGKKSLDLLFVGSVTPRKGLDTLVESFKILLIDYGVENLILHIAGALNKEPNFSNKIEEYCEREGIKNNIVFYGRVSEDTLSKLYATADIFVFPSLCEGFGMVLIEAMYNKLPIVATNVGAIPSLVKDGQNGFLVPPLNPKGLADVTKKLIESTDLRKQFGEHNCKIAQDFNWAETFAKIENFIAASIKK